MLVPRAAIQLRRSWQDNWEPCLLSASSNGLASGNTRAEALIHALYEVIEPDATAALRVVPVAKRTYLDSYSVPGYCAKLIEGIHAADAWLEIVAVPSRFDAPCFAAYLWREDFATYAIGAGAHSDPAVALSRAITEAAQSRLTAIVGSRDDIPPYTYSRPGAFVARPVSLHKLSALHRWRRHVLAWIATAAGPPARDDDWLDVESLALAAAEAKGIALRYLSAAQLEHWLTRDELADLPNAEKLARILVRSVMQDPDAAVWPTCAHDAPGLFNPAIDSASAAASVFRRNDEVTRSGPNRTVYELRTDKVREHVGKCWGIDPHDEPALTAAVRDRGFHAAAGAIEVARAFFLSALSTD